MASRQAPLLGMGRKYTTQVRGRPTSCNRLAGLQWGCLVGEARWLGAQPPKMAGRAGPGKNGGLKGCCSEQRRTATRQLLGLLVQTKGQGAEGRAKNPGGAAGGGGGRAASQARAA